MERLSLSEFMDVMARTGAHKAGRLAGIKHKAGYRPSMDFYKLLREKVVDVFKHSLDRACLDEVVEQAYPTRRGHYQEAIAGLKKWWGRKRLAWFDPSRGDYGEGAFRIHINPELGLFINGAPHLVKLYFRSDRLPKNSGDMITYMMRAALPGPYPEGTKMAVLDVKHATLLDDSHLDPHLGVAIKGELAYVAALWDDL